MLLKLNVDGFLEVVGVVGDDEDTWFCLGERKILGNECDLHFDGFAWCYFSLR